MHISRIEVEGGFLDGLDLELASGLNVIIGPRGTGKTSIIELVRYALGVARLAPTSSRLFEQARAVLGAGRVSVTVQNEGEAFRVVRSGSEVDPVEPVIGQVPLILAQNEIEEVGKDPYGRLNLIDGYRTDREASRRYESEVRGRAKALTAAIAAAGAEAATLHDELSAQDEVAAALKAAEEVQAQFATSTASHTVERETLASVDGDLTAVRLRVGALERALASLRVWTQHLEAASVQAPMLEAPKEGVPDPLADVRPLVQQASAQSEDVLSTASRALAVAELRLTEDRKAQDDLEAQARDLRRQLESAQEGAGAAARTAAELRSRAAELASLSALVEQKQARIRELQTERESALAELERLRTERFDRRSEASSHLNQLLAPHIEVSVTRSGLFDGYVTALIGALQGSNLRYNALAPQIATSVPPAELVRIAEAGDASALAEIVGLDRDRAARIVGYLSDHGLDDVLGVEVEDFVEFLLLDGTEYKPTEQLSTGQRCTVVLPILLEYAGRPLIVDQPEDHLDNNFVADILIPAILRRKADTQVIVSSHNANIPVLGDADRVFSLGSNGTRGFVKVAGGLDDPEIVDAITSVMEGGREAFQRRAAFYKERLGLG